MNRSLATCGLLVVGVVIAAGGCGGGDDGGDGGGGGASASTSGGAPSGAAREALPIAYGLPRVVSTNVYLSRAMVVQAVYAASQMSGSAFTGRVATTGTLAQTPVGWQYAPTPTDKLIVRFGGQNHEFVVRNVQGNAAAPTPDAWLMLPHALSYRHTLPDVGEADIEATFDGQRFEANITGWTTVQGKRYDVTLRAAGATASQSDGSGQEVRTEYAVTGKLSGAGVEVDVNERHVSTMASASSLRLLPSQRGFASRFNGTINNVLRVGGETYAFQNVTVVTDQSARGGQGNAGVTAAGGQVTRNGSAWGTCVLQAGRVFLQTAGGPVALDVTP